MWVGVESYFLPILCAVTQAVPQSGGVGVGGGVSHRDNLSLGSLMENRKALHSACERAAAGCDQQTAPNTVAPQPVHGQSAQDVAMSPCELHPSCWCVVFSNQAAISAIGST